MGKIKKLYKYSLVLLVLIVLLPGTAYLALKIPSVQTYLAARLMKRVSSKIQGNIEFTHIHFSYFNNIKVTDLLIKDYKGDTLLYSPFVDAGIRKIKKSERLLRLGRISIEKPLINLEPDSTGRLNLLYYTDLIVPEDTASRIKDLSISRISISDGTLRYSDGSTGSAVAGLFDPSKVSLSELNVTIENLHKLWSDISLSLEELSFVSSSGFRLTNLFTSLVVDADGIQLIEPTIRTDNSIINSDLIGINFTNNPEFDFLRDASLNLQFSSSVIGLRDLGYFIEEMKGYNQDFMLSGDIRGSIAELKGRNIKINHSDTTFINFDFDLSGLPDLENTFMFIDVEELSTHTSEIEAVKIPGKGYINLGENLRSAGNIQFIGNFTGFITDFVTYGNFTTDLGRVATDIRFKPDTSSSFIYNGFLNLSEINIGKLSGNENSFGFASVSINVDGSSESFDRFRADIEGKIDSLEFNNYNYRDILISGFVTERIFDGSVIANTQDLRMDLLGRFDFSDSIPEMDFSLNLLNADLCALNIASNDSSANLSLLLTANILGNKLDKLTGDIRMLNSRFERNGEVLELYNASIKARQENDLERIDLSTDFMEAYIEGQYTLSSIAGDFKNVAYNILPSLSDKSPGRKIGSGNKFTYGITFRNTRSFNEFFNTGFYLAEGTGITGKFFPGETITLNSTGDYLTYKTHSLVDFKIKGELKDSLLSFDLNGSRANLANRIDINSFLLETRGIPDSLKLDISWTNPENKGKGLVSMAGSLDRKENGNKIFTAYSLPTEMNINNNTWKISRSEVHIDSTSVNIRNFRLDNGRDLIMVDGRISENPEDSVYISFNNLDLAALNEIKQQDAETNEDRIEFFVFGSLNGDIVITDIYNKLLFESNISVRDFKTNEHEHGDVNLISEWNSAMGVADIELFNDLNGLKTFDVSGYYSPEERNLNLLTEVNRIPLDLLNLVLYSFASGVKGYASGKVLISGNPSSPVITGNVMAEDASMVIDYLQTRFMFSDTIRLEENGYFFDSIEIRDDRGNRAMLDGYVTHNAFDDFKVGIRIDANNMRVLDTRQKDNDLFYGTAYASGVINIISDDADLELDISARTEQNTRIFFPLKQNEQVSDYSFISFKDPLADSSGTKEITLPVILPKPESSIGLGLNLDVTQDAEIQLVFDASVGDVLRSTGSGNLNMTLDSEGNFSMFGDYTIEDGDYQLTLGNIFNKRFIVEEGGYIRWNGDITNAELDIKAIYRLRASLYELLLVPEYKERIPVECHLNMSGQLVDPVIEFDIFLPTADEKMRTDLRNAINSDEEMSRQFLYLLVMNSFYPDPSYASAEGATSSGASAMGVTTTEMLSNQLSNWLSQISNDFDIGFAYRPGNDISSQEVEVALSTQLLDDRVTINGNFAVAGQETSNNMNDLTGDFDVEVKLTEKVRLKVFNRSNDNLYYETAPYTQGFGFFFRQEFNKLRDIFRRPDRDIKKEDDIKIVKE